MQGLIDQALHRLVLLLVAGSCLKPAQDLAEGAACALAGGLGGGGMRMLTLLHSERVDTCTPTLWTHADDVV
ncbi:hypothetical protein AWN90_14220 [Nocardia terpenica]|uniref:Uncharacterized protein n=1 Tax=Nocardia terpenica TaxID=455432 RepID=A0A164HY65_9NOCA|nr:hypothetical protein AWN90_14220 [Nocardia terpenica]